MVVIDVDTFFVLVVPKLWPWPCQCTVKLLALGLLSPETRSVFVILLIVFNQFYSLVIFLKVILAILVIKVVYFTADCCTIIM